ncbi:fimbrial protein [Serratia sp. C2(1)]|nr:fimbrial protein [Serratia sp. C2(2)]MEE4449669.1 fimbrial protein [Serratia sp. C2(1)]
MMTASDWRYYGTAGLLALMVPLSLGVMAMLVPPVKAMDNWNVDGANGVLYVRGALTESACRLEMTSAYQDVWLGEIGTGRLPEVGSQGEPVSFQLRLKDCHQATASNRDARTGAMAWSDKQPAVSVSFNATTDMNNPQLVMAHGVSGMALRLNDMAGHDVRLGDRGQPLLLTPGQDALTYTVRPERTRAPLQAGAYRAQVDFKLNYD